MTSENELPPAIRATPCPFCGGMELALTYQLVAKPIGDFSLSGHQMKFSAVRYPVIYCKAEGCDFRARGHKPA